MFASAAASPGPGATEQGPRIGPDSAAASCGPEKTFPRHTYAGLMGLGTHEYRCWADRNHQPDHYGQPEPSCAPQDHRTRRYGEHGTRPTCTPLALPKRL